MQNYPKKIIKNQKKWKMSKNLKKLENLKKLRKISKNPKKSEFFFKKNGKKPQKNPKLSQKNH